MIDFVQWCAICNAAPAEGTLTVEDEGDVFDLQTCKSCVAKIAQHQEVPNWKG